MKQQMIDQCLKASTCMLHCIRAAFANPSANGKQALEVSFKIKLEAQVKNLKILGQNLRLVV